MVIFNNQLVTVRISDYTLEPLTVTGQRTRNTVNCVKTFITFINVYNVHLSMAYKTGDWCGEKNKYSSILPATTALCTVAKCNIVADKAI